MRVNNLSNLKYSLWHLFRRRRKLFLTFMLLIGCCLLLLGFHWETLDTSYYTLTLRTITSTRMIINYYNTSNDFQTMSNLNGTYLYSAYLDERQRKVRIISVSDNAGPVYCLFWYRNGNYLYSAKPIPACFHKHTDHHLRQFSATFVTCYLEDNSTPDAVSVVQDQSINKKPYNLLPVNKLKASETKHKFTVCLSPLQYNFGDVRALVEWLELIQLQGVTHVDAYVHNATNDVISVLKLYRSSGLVTILPWTLPASFCDDKIRKSHYCGQIAAINDCVYRNKGKSDFVASLDLDEVIVPQHKNDFTWGDMLKRVPNASSFIIRNVFFKPTEQKGITKHINLTSNLISSNVREEYVFGPRNRSKWIVRPEMVVAAGIHHQWAIDSRAREFTMPFKMGLLHHYRKHSIYKDGFKRMNVQHDAALKYTNKFKSSLENIYTKLNTMNIALNT